MTLQVTFNDGSWTGEQTLFLFFLHSFFWSEDFLYMTHFLITQLLIHQIKYIYLLKRHAFEGFGV